MKLTKLARTLDHSGTKSKNLVKKFQEIYQ